VNFPSILRQKKKLNGPNVKKMVINLTHFKCGIHHI